VKLLLSRGGEVYCRILLSFWKFHVLAAV
jgi:hypothetical protein